MFFFNDKNNDKNNGMTEDQLIVATAMMSL